MKSCKWMLAFGLVFNFAPAGATIIHDTATTWVLHDALNDNVVIENPDAKLIVATGGAVLSGVRTRTGTMDVTGAGRVIGLPNQNAVSMGGGRSTVHVQDQATIVGGIYSDLSMGWDDESTATIKLYLQDQSMVVGDINYSGYLRIEDQAIVRGNISNVVSGNIGIDMSDGLVTGVVHLGAGNMMSLNLDGGAILGGVRGIWGDLDVQMSGGTIEGGFWTGAAVNGEIRGGRINDGVLIASSVGSSNLRITGGQFDTALDNWLVQFANEPGYPGGGRSGLLELSGGQFGYAGAGRGFLIDDLMSFSVYGRDLIYSDGWLTGYLMDGSWFNNALTFGSNWQGTFTIHNVPEPETLGLLVAGLVGMTLAKRRGGRRTASLR